MQESELEVLRQLVEAVKDFKTNSVDLVWYAQNHKPVPQSVFTEFILSRGRLYNALDSAEDVLRNND